MTEEREIERLEEMEWESVTVRLKVSERENERREKVSGKENEGKEMVKKKDEEKKMTE